MDRIAAYEQGLLQYATEALANLRESPAYRHGRGTRRACSPSLSKASMRTMSAPYWIRKASPSARDITAPSR